MSILTNWFRGLVSKRNNFRNTVWNGLAQVKSFADQPDASSKQLVVKSTVQGTENEARLRVRRARPGDVPRALRFVRDHARAAWPGLTAPPAAPNLVLCDYVARALAQGHSMVAEQQESRRGETRIRGLALGVSVCAWDADVLERWAHCVRCARARRLVAFAAHCLRAPALHDKYCVHNILQTILIVPQDSTKSTEIVNMLAKNSIKRCEEVGIPLIRFDVTCDNMAKILEELELKKEWQLSYDVLPESPKDIDPEKVTSDSEPKTSAYKHRIAVYAAEVNAENYKHKKK